MRIDFERHRTMTATGRQPIRRPWIALLNAVLSLAGDRAELVCHDEKPWASITFAGSRHTVVLAFRGADALEDGEAFIADLPEHEFAIPRQIVIEAAIVQASHELLPEPVLTVKAELLLLEEG